MKKRIFAAPAVALAALMALPVTAQIAGGKPVRIVVTSAAGSTPDVLARLLATQMTEHWRGQSVIVENRSGGLGAIAVENVQRSSADGTTLMLTDSAVWAITQNIMPKPPFDAVRDLQPIAQVAIAPSFLVVNAKLPVKTVGDLVEMAGKSPGKMTYGTPGNGSVHHIRSELFKLQAGVDLLHVPYKGVSQASAGLAAGEVDIAFMGYTAVAPMIQRGAARIIAAATEQRMPLMPDLPTMTEAGIKGPEMSSTRMGIFGPPNMPRDSVSRIVEALNAALQSADIKTKLNTLGLVPAILSGEPFASSIRNDIVQYGDLIRRANIKAD